MCAHFTPEILQPGAVKGLITTLLEADGTLEFKNELNDFCSCHDIVQGNVILVVWMKAGLMQRGITSSGGILLLNCKNSVKMMLWCNSIIFTLLLCHDVLCMPRLSVCVCVLSLSLPLSFSPPPLSLSLSHRHEKQTT